MPNDVTMVMRAGNSGLSGYDRKLYLLSKFPFVIMDSKSINKILETT